MKVQRQCDQAGSSARILFLFFFAFAAWIFLFRDFLSGKIGFASDAVSYYEHIKFYIENIARGIYPLWDPTWECGSPNDFFLRRICPYNPFLLIIPTLTAVGLLYMSAYLVFLAAYYFIGTLGFYLLAKNILQDKASAFVAFLLLTFSSLGTRLFDSYLIFVCTPLVWFFYFFMAFVKERRRRDLLGAVFSLMILLTTYIPFYAITILLLFFLVGVVFYFRDIKKSLPQYMAFIKNNKAFISLCIFLLILAAAPGIMFYVGAEKNDFVLPYRNSDSVPGNALTVDNYDITWWAILEEAVYSSAFMSNLPRLQLEVFYLPIFIYLILLLGLKSTLNRRLAFLAAWGFLIFLMSIPEAGVYHFFQRLLFYFKYFRNLHFFLWVIILPLIIFFTAEQFRVFFADRPIARKKWFLTIAYIAFVHLGFAFFIHRQGDGLISSYLTISASFAFFVLYALGKIRYGNFSFLAMLFVIITAQPGEVYTHLHLSKNIKVSPTQTNYDLPLQKFLFVMRSKDEGLSEETIERDKGNPHPAPIYFGTQRYYFLLESLNPRVFTEYARHKFKVYDRVEWVKGDSDIKIARIERMFLKNENTAVVSTEGERKGAREGTQVLNQSDAPVAEPIEGNSERFQLLASDANSIKFKTNFEADKFLVYNDNFYSGWRAFINGKEVKLWRANIAFKGVFLPKGENTIYLRFEAMGYYVFNFFLIGVFYGVFFYLLWNTARPYLIRKTLEIGEK